MMRAGTRWAGLALLLTAAGCGPFHVAPAPAPKRAAATAAGDTAGAQASDSARVAEARRIEHEAGPARPELAPPTSPSGKKVWQQALSARRERIVVSVDHRWLWLMEGDTAVFGAPVAVGTQDKFTYRGRTYDFQTPRAEWKVQGKEPNPLWVPPAWHYYEKAVDENLDVVQLKPGQKYPLKDGTVIEVRGDQVGRVNTYGNFWPFTPGTEIIFEGKIFVPPVGTSQRKVPEILGTHRLILGDGYLIHGTNEADSIGEPVSHGCVRMYNEDIDHLYALVPIGTPVYIY